MPRFRLLLLLFCVACNGEPTPPPSGDIDIIDDVEVMEDIDANDAEDIEIIEDIDDTDDIDDGDVEEETTELPETVDPPELPDLELSDTPECSQPTATTGEFDLQMGKLISNKIYTEIEPFEAIEIVQGPQGGVHIEIAFRATLPEPFNTESKAKVEAEARSYMNCCEAPEVGYFHFGKYLLYKEKPEGAVFLSGVIPVIFEQNQAFHYDEQYCCVELTLGVRLPGDSEPSLWSTVRHTFYCVDYF